MALPSLAGLSLGPPTGPIARYGKEVIESPSPEESGGKRAKGPEGLTVKIVKYDTTDERDAVCPISRRTFVPGEWVYKTPDGHVYDPWSVLKLWREQEVEEEGRDRFWNLYTNKNDISRAEYVALSIWEVDHKESERPDSPEDSSFDIAKYLHKPPAGARQPPVPEQVQDDSVGLLLRLGDENGISFRELANIRAGPGDLPWFYRKLIEHAQGQVQLSRLNEEWDGAPRQITYFGPCTGVPVTWKWRNEPDTVEMNAKFAPNSALGRRLATMIQDYSGVLWVQGGEHDIAVSIFFLKTILSGATRSPAGSIRDLWDRLSSEDYNVTLTLASPDFYELKVKVSTKFMAAFFPSDESTDPQPKTSGFDTPTDPKWMWPPNLTVGPLDTSGDDGFHGLATILVRTSRALHEFVKKVVLSNSNQIYLTLSTSSSHGGRGYHMSEVALDNTKLLFGGEIHSEAQFFYAVTDRGRRE